MQITIKFIKRQTPEKKTETTNIGYRFSSRLSLGGFCLN